MNKNPLARTAIRLKSRLRWLRHNLADAWNPPSPEQRCPLCRATHPTRALVRLASRCIFGGGRLIRYQCPECDLIFGTRRMLEMGPAELGREYRELYATYAEADSTESEMCSFRALSPQPGGVYLNYGCGRWSEALSRLRTEGIDVYGYEPFVQDAGVAPSYILTEEQRLAGMRFDGILTHNILEHVQDPVAFVAKLVALLKPGGVLVHATPCFEYAYAFSRFHLVFFPGRSAERLADACGLSAGELEVPYPGQLLRRFARKPGIVSAENPRA